MTETEIESFSENCKKRTLRSERVVLLIKGKLYDLPSESSKTYFTLNDNPKSIIGVYNRASTARMIFEDILEFLKENESV